MLRASRGCTRHLGHSRGRPVRPAPCPRPFPAGEAWDPRGAGLARPRTHSQRGPDRAALACRSRGVGHHHTLRGCQGHGVRRLGQSCRIREPPSTAGAGATRQGPWLRPAELRPEPALPPAQTEGMFTQTDVNDMPVRTAAAARMDSNSLPPGGRLDPSSDRMSVIFRNMGGYVAKDSAKPLKIRVSGGRSGEGGWTTAAFQRPFSR